MKTPEVERLASHPDLIRLQESPVKLKISDTSLSERVEDNNAFVQNLVNKESHNVTCLGTVT